MADDVLDAIHTFRVAMRRAGFEPPEAVIFRNVDDGMRLRAELLQHPNIKSFATGDPIWGKPVEHPNGSVWMEIEIMEIKLRWPATKEALPKGGYVWR